jgi:hypothetical protein
MIIKAIIRVPRKTKMNFSKGTTTTIRVEISNTARIMAVNGLFFDHSHTVFMAPSKPILPMLYNKERVKSIDLLPEK